MALCRRSLPWEKEELEYFDTLQDESPWDLHAVAYVEALQELRTAQCAFASANMSDH